MRQSRLIFDGSVCEGDFMEGINTVDEVRMNADNKERCRFFPNECPTLDTQLGPFCIYATGHTVAQFVTKLGTSLDAEMNDFNTEAPMPPRGYFDPTEEEPGDSTTDRAEVVRRVKIQAAKILDILEIDAPSINNEFRQKPGDALLKSFPVLGESIYDEEESVWIHSCGTMVAFADVHRTVRDDYFPLSGSGEVVTEEQPYCPSCSEKPNKHGAPISAKEAHAKDINEIERLRRIGKKMNP